jgi:hypothetical protein
MFMISKKMLFLTTFFMLFLSTIANAQSPPLGDDIGVLQMAVDFSGNALGTLNITNNGSIRVGAVMYSNGGPWTVGSAQNFQTWLKNGYANGSWNGLGILSSYAASDPLDFTGINWCTGQEYLDVIGDTFHEVTVQPNDILASFGYVGDCNMDGKVDGTDLDLFNYAFDINPSGTTLAQFNAASGTGYAALSTMNGDFDYNGIVDFGDYVLINRVYATGGIPYGLSNPSVDPVPEPSILCLIGMGAVVLLCSAWRKRK